MVLFFPVPNVMQNVRLLPGLICFARYIFQALAFFLLVDYCTLVFLQSLISLLPSALFLPDLAPWISAAQRLGMLVTMYGGLW